MRVAIRRLMQVDAALCFFFRSAATQAVTNKMQNCLCFVICIIAVYPRATRLGLQSWPMVLLRSTDQLISNMQFNHWPRWCWLQHLSSRAMLTSSNQNDAMLGFMGCIHEYPCQFLVLWHFILLSATEDRESTSIKRDLYWLIRIDKDYQWVAKLQAFNSVTGP